jgi:hypothetical protein
LLQVLEEEYNGSTGALTTRLYYDPFQISITHGDQVLASNIVERGYKSRVVCGWEGSPETGNIKNLMRTQGGIGIPGYPRGVKLLKSWCERSGC